MKKMISWPLLLVAVVAPALAGCKATRSGYESAPYKVVRSDGKFQVRDYPALAVVETTMAAGSRDGSDGSDGSFMRLFRFITGGNEAQQKIAMTTPVFMSGETNTTMAFVMPAKLKVAGVPKPSDGSVMVRELSAGQFAVLRYSGGRNAANEAQSLEQLRTYMKSAGPKELSSPVHGYFDPPRTPAFLRRNEVMIRIETSGA